MLRLWSLAACMIRTTSQFLALGRCSFSHNNITVPRYQASVSQQSSVVERENTLALSRRDAPYARNASIADRMHVVWHPTQWHRCAVTFIFIIAGSKRVLSDLVGSRGSGKCGWYCTYRIIPYHTSFLDPGCCTDTSFVSLI